MRRIFSLFILLGLLATGCVSGAGAELDQSEEEKESDCDETKIVVIDFGSSEIKAKSACVKKSTVKNDINHYKIKKIDEIKGAEIKFEPGYLKSFTPIVCKKDTDKSLYADGVFEKLRSLEKTVSAEKANSIRSAATAAFRSSKNGAKFIDNVNKCFPYFRVRIISQKLEGELEFRSVVARQAQHKDSVSIPDVVWGVGSTSTQITAYYPNKAGYRSEFVVVNAGNGAIPFCYWLVGEQKSKEPDTACEKNSPPTLTQDERAVFANRKGTWVRNNQVPAYLSGAFVGKNVFGLGGGIFYLELPKDSAGNDKSVFNLDDVSVALDTDLNNRSHEHATTNLILVEGVMKAMKFKSVTRAVDKLMRPGVSVGLAVIEDW